MTKGTLLHRCPRQGFCPCAPWLLSVFSQLVAERTPNGRRSSEGPRAAARPPCPSPAVSRRGAAARWRVVCLRCGCSHQPARDHEARQVLSAFRGSVRVRYCGEQVCLCGPGLVSSAGDAGCSESGLTEPECWLIHRSHKGRCLLWIAGRWP